MPDHLDDVLDTNAQLAKAWKALDRLGQLDPDLASEEFDHLRQLLAHFTKTMSKPSDYLLANDVYKRVEFDDFRADLLDYLRDKANAECRSRDNVAAHNARLGPTYWCKSAFEQVQSASFKDVDKFLSSHGIVGDGSKTLKAVSEAYQCILEIVEAEFSHSGNLCHIRELVDRDRSQSTPDKSVRPVAKKGKRARLISPLGASHAGCNPSHSRPALPCGTVQSASFFVLSMNAKGIIIVT